MTGMAVVSNLQLFLVEKKSRVKVFGPFLAWISSAAGIAAPNHLSHRLLDSACTVFGSSDTRLVVIAGFAGSHTAAVEHIVGSLACRDG